MKGDTLKITFYAEEHDMWITYEIKCTAYWRGRDDEPDGEIWEYVDQSATVSEDVEDFEIVDQLAEANAKARGYVE